MSESIMPDDAHWWYGTYRRPYTLYMWEFKWLHRYDNPSTERRKRNEN